MTALTELLAKVEAGEIGGGLNTASVFGDTKSAMDAVDAFYGSLDAARELHEAVLPHHYAQLHMWPMPEMTRVDIGGGHVGRDNIPARAWLIAILRALIAKEGDT